MENIVGRARDYALRLLGKKARTRKELEERMRKKGFDREVIARTIEWLQELGYINDEEYARRRVEYILTSSPRGRTQLLRELRQRGIDKELAERVVDEKLSQVDEYKLAKEAAERKLPSYHHLERKVARRRLYAYLKRRTFSHDVVMKVLEEFLPKKETSQ